MTIEEAFVELENYIDASDPDMDLVRNKYMHIVLLPFIHALIICLTLSPPYLLLIDRVWTHHKTNTS